MMKFFLLIVITLCICSHFTLGSQKYQPDWESLDSRPLPTWYDEAKFGIFVHYGVFSVPSYGCGTLGEWYWWYLNGAHTHCVQEFHNSTYGPDFKYEEFAPMFKPILFNPDQWAQLFKMSGAKYVVLTSKHHEGFCMWPSAQSWNWNSVDVGPHQDIVGMVTEAVRKAGLKMGLYHSLFEWFNPLYLQDRANNGTTNNYVTQILLPQLYDIVKTYKPELIWSDGDWEMSDKYWQSKEFLAWLYNDSPVKDTICVNDRWGAEDDCKHGGYFTCSDRYNPGTLQPHKWENCMTIDAGSWGYNRNTPISGYLSIEDLLSQLVSTVACGGNVLLNVGPASDGTIHPIYQERLLQVGNWLSVNGEAIYSSSPWRAQNETASNVWYTMNNKTQAVYAVFLEWPADNIIALSDPVPSQDTEVVMLGLSDSGDAGKLKWTYDNNVLHVHLPTVPVSQLPCKWAWTLKMQNVK